MSGHVWIKRNIWGAYLEYSVAIFFCVFSVVKISLCIFCRSDPPGREMLMILSITRTIKEKHVDLEDLQLP